MIEELLKELDAIHRDLLAGDNPASATQRLGIVITNLKNQKSKLVECWDARNPDDMDSPDPFDPM